MKVKPWLLTGSGSSRDRPREELGFIETLEPAGGWTKPRDDDGWPWTARRPRLQLS